MATKVATYAMIKIENKFLVGELNTSISTPVNLIEVSSKASCRSSRFEYGRMSNTVSISSIGTTDGASSAETWQALHNASVSGVKVPIEFTQYDSSGAVVGGAVNFSGTALIGNITKDHPDNDRITYSADFTFDGDIDKGSNLIIIYGFLYNWFAVNSQITSSDLWRVPNYLDVDSLVTYIDPSGLPNNNVAGGRLKQIGTTYWKSPNTNATDEYGLSMRASGRRDVFGTFSSILDSFIGWTLTEYDLDNSRSAIYSASFNDGILNHYVPFDNWYHAKKEVGHATRLIRDAIGVADGTKTVYIGNDEKVYEAIAINEMYWTTRNLAETKYRNGDWIPGYDAGVYTPIDNTTWVGLTTGALCAYNNDINNAFK